MKKTFYLDKDGIRVDGCRTKSEAQKAWTAKRDAWAERAASCRPWVFLREGFVCVVSPNPECWEYTIAKATSDAGVRWASCTYSAPSQVAAIASATSALAQRLWSLDVINDAVFFDALVADARLTVSEAASHRSDFLYLASRWREPRSAA